MKGNNILKTNRTFNMRAPAIRGGGPDILLVMQYYVHKERIRIYTIPDARGLMKIHPPRAREPGPRNRVKERYKN